MSAITNSSSAVRTITERMVHCAYCTYVKDKLQQRMDANKTPVVVDTIIIVKFP